MDLRGWLSRFFRASIVGQEALFSCPKCKHSRFYFNLSKRIGYCHHARCHYTPTLDDLIQIVGHGPSESFLTSSVISEPEDTGPEEIVLPEGTEELVRMENGQLVTNYPLAAAKVAERGVSPSDQYRFNLHIGNGKVYIPIYHEGKLYNYVGRTAWWLPFQSAKRYEYKKGVKTNNFIFNWDEAKTWKNLTLVENTFNAIWLNKFCATSNFGSHLSDKQIELISQGRASKTGSIVLLWDEGADRSAARAVRKLRKRGFDAAYVQISGQPDDHNEEYLEDIIETAHEKAKRGVTCLTFRLAL